MNKHEISYISPVFFFNDTATTEIYTLSLHDALPISSLSLCMFRSTDLRNTKFHFSKRTSRVASPAFGVRSADRKSTRLNSSHLVISYAVFCLKKKRIHLLDRGEIATEQSAPAELCPS